MCYRKVFWMIQANQRSLQSALSTENLKPPATWQEYTELAEFFTHPAKHFYGTYIQGKRVSHSGTSG